MAHLIGQPYMSMEQQPREKKYVPVTFRLQKKKSDLGAPMIKPGLRGDYPTCSHLS